MFMSFLSVSLASVYCFCLFLHKELREHLMAFFLAVFRTRSKGEVVNEKGEGTFQDAY